MSKFFSNIISGVLVSAFSLLAINVSAAGVVSVSPPLIDYVTEGRDIINRNITLINNGSKAVRLYASVHEVNLGDKTEILDFVPGSMGNRTTSITSWIEITRARIELKPGEEKVVPLTIRIHPETPSGTYHAVVGFVEGTNRDQVEEKVKSGSASTVIIKISINDKRREQLHLTSFVSDRFTFQEGKNQMSYTVENTGDLPITPKGEIIIYDTTGKELSSLLVNQEKAVLLPGEKKQFTEVLPFINKLGKNKAYLALEYGASNQANVFDTTFYYSIPWFYLLGIILLLLALLTMTAIAFRKMFAQPTDIADGGVYDLPMFVKDSKEHSVYDHDLNLKKDESNS